MRGKIGSVPRIITEWNYPRIALALGGIAVIAALVIYFAYSKPQQAAADKLASTTAADIAIVGDVKDGGNTNIAAGSGALKKKIRRAQLAAKIVNSEPVGEISPPIQAGEKTPVLVYYFVELADMKGKAVFHEWLLDGKLISKKVVNISDNTWRTSSRQMIAYTTNSNWTVRLVDDTGQVLSEKKFTVILGK
jgi:hypothetical protein